MQENWLKANQANKPLQTTKDLTRGSGRETHPRRVADAGKLAKSVGIGVRTQLSAFRSQGSHHQDTILFLNLVYLNHVEPSVKPNLNQSNRE
jgi:hypothetical protein